MTERTAPPPGYWEDAQGNFIPESKIKDVDKVRDELVKRLSAQAETLSETLARFKAAAMGDVSAFVSISAEEYGAKIGGEKGNITLLSFDGRWKMVRQIQEQIAFGEQLVAAKALIDECVRSWSEGADDNIKALVGHAFQTDQQGKINTGRVLGLRRLEIRDAKWQQAMRAISDSIRTQSSKPYVRFYRRDDSTQEYVPISLDIAAL